MKTSTTLTATVAAMLVFAATIGAANAQEKPTLEEATLCPALQGLVFGDDELSEAFIAYADAFEDQTWGYGEVVESATDSLLKAPAGHKYAGQYYYDAKSVAIGLAAKALLESSVHVTFDQGPELVTITVSGPNGDREGTFTNAELAKYRQVVFGYIMSWALHVAGPCD